jgi:solute carrier family 25 (mitochondrial S-adenosylmethionine transporter), member 26
MPRCAAEVAHNTVIMCDRQARPCLQNGEFTNARTAVSTIIRKEGRRGMFAGYGAFLLRDLPFDAIEFWAFDTLKINYQRAIGRDLNGLEASACGAAAGGFTGAPSRYAAAATLLVWPPGRS